ncbi:ATP-dependent RNA helicase, putative [Ricinus communis]|uniref:ATP-dependent RNA helicase, putative n=1 Tax=Ricinus communis TaxID=3988 RepID=B9S326_RICCO|nr:ATP-dependent RNA helicase, putative [Ricinus communis]|eukprot:XP_002520395.1 DExH-box ATP-dependent RNA helicase DExH6 [Ricinus communis]
MGKKRQKKAEQGNPNVAEATRIRISQILEQFRAAKDQVFTFEANLSNRERAVVHEVCKKLGMKSKSTGRGHQRRVSIYKIIQKADTGNGKESLTNLTFSEESKLVLQELFAYYPPEDGELGAKIVGNCKAKDSIIQGKKDGIFSMPSMAKADITKKVESLNSRIEKDANLRQIVEQRSKLPIASFRDVITSTVESHQIVLISGETGCGKTTQVPQYLLEYKWGKCEACKIICTQPRRISAISVAERISSERGENVGDDIGYKIRLESKGGKNSSIVLCTNGVLLRLLVSRGTRRSKKKSSKNAKDDISNITHIIVDEIHERDRYSDFILAIIRDILPSYPHLRLILMSATLDSERFSQYFGGCPIVRVPGFTYPVKNFYLEDVLSILNSADNNHIDSAMPSIPIKSHELREEDRAAVDEAINLAWTNDEFDTLLDLVSSEGIPEVYNFQESSTGLSPLMVFAGKGRVDDVCMLLSFNADCHLQDKDGLTALEWAKRENQHETAEVLKRHVEVSPTDCREQQQLLDNYLGKINPELVDVSLIERLLRKICISSRDGAILVFLPGWDDIRRTREGLLANPFFKDSSKFLIISLHSMVPSMEQKKVFKRPPQGCRKIILSTNIAETSITIDDVIYVIDSGRMKEKSYDPYNNVSTLQSSWVSKASSKQREGRAGRCQPGMCYHLYSKLRAASMPDFQVPEIRRMPIEELCLQVKLLDPNCKIEEFLGKMLDPPVPETIRNAILVLQDIGALSPDEQLTEVGEKLGCLPVHPLISKMLFFAILMNCLDPALTMACASDYRDPFTLPVLPNEKKRAAATKFELASLYGGRSDQLAVIAAYECWKNAKERGQEARFCSQYFISSSTMIMLHGMRKQLLSELIRNGFIQEDASCCNVNSHDPGILYAVLVAGLYPMVGRVLPPRNGKRFIVETATGAKVRLHPQSLNFKLLSNKTDDCSLIIFDEITRGEWGMNIRNCTIVGPLALLLLATEIVVTPAKDHDEEDNEGDDNNDGSDTAPEDEGDEDKMEIDDRLGGHNDEKIMSSPDNSVNVVVDRWLYFSSTALEVAQIYCLRERLSAAILFRVMHPKQELPPALAASMRATACVLSYDGQSGISLPQESVDSLASMVDATEIDSTAPGRRKAMGHNPSGFLRSLMSNRRQQTTPHHYRNARLPAFKGKSNINQPSTCKNTPPVSSLDKIPDQRPPLQGHTSGKSGSSPRGDSSKRQRGNASKNQ